MARKQVNILGKMFTIVDTGHTQLSHAVCLAYSLSYCMQDERIEVDDPESLAIISSKVLYTYDSVTQEVARYNDNGSGCVLCYMDTNEKWWLVANVLHNGDLVTVFHTGSDEALYMDSAL